MANDLDVVILAAGLGTRMKSSRIKILHEAAGRPIIDYVIDLAAGVSSRKPVMVIGHQREAVTGHCGERAQYAVQDAQLGTGHAVLQAADAIEGGDRPILVLSGDAPLTRAETIQSLLQAHTDQGNAVTILSMRPSDAAGYGRIVRDREGRVTRIVELKDASPEEREIGEVNAGIYVFQPGDLFRILRTLSTDNAQGEYYLTDVIGRLREEGKTIGAFVVPDAMEALGVNSRAELALVERELLQRKISSLMKDGVTFRDPSSVLIDWQVTIGPDTVIYPFVTIEGASAIGSDCRIEPGAHLVDCTIGDRVRIKTGTVAEGCRIDEEAAVGPYAHLRPGTVLGRKVKVGNFVETKKAVFGEGSKASHLSYIGDAEVGRDVNIGAGTITCNYDGVNKHKTVLEDGVFIGSDSQLVAPIRVGRGAYVAAGSTITKDVPAESLALSRTPQRIVDGWASRKKTSK